MIQISETHWINPDKISYIRLEAFKTSDPAVNQVRHVVVMINGKDLVIERPEAISILLKSPEQEDQNERILKISAQKYQVLKSFKAANNDLIIEAGLVLHRKEFDGKIRWVAEENSMMEFDWQNINNPEFFAPASPLRVLPTPNTDK